LHEIDSEKDAKHSIVSMQMSTQGNGGGTHAWIERQRALMDHNVLLWVKER